MSIGTLKDIGPPRDGQERMRTNIRPKISIGTLAERPVFGEIGLPLGYTYVTTDEPDGYVEYVFDPINGWHRVVPSTSSIQIPVNSTSNRAMAGLVTTADGDLATATTVAKANQLSAQITLTINGQTLDVGNGTKVGVVAYISGDGGVTARTFADVGPGDTIRWNGSVAGFQLDALDTLGLNYETI